MPVIAPLLETLQKYAIVKVLYCGYELVDASQQFAATIMECLYSISVVEENSK